jgi:hypothetical protein
MLTEGGKTAERRLEFGFELATGRPASPREMAVLRGSLNSELIHYARHEDLASALTANGDSPVKPGIARTELAAWTTVASMILNLDETVSKQ